MSEENKDTLQSEIETHYHSKTEIQRTDRQKNTYAKRPIGNVWNEHNRKGKQKIVQPNKIIQPNKTQCNKQ